MNDYYGLLGVSKQEMDQDADSLKRAYRKRALELHPDKHPDSSEEFKRMLSAYNILSDSELRAVVDVLGNDVDCPKEVLEQVKSIFPNMQISTACELARDVVPNLLRCTHSSPADLVELSLSITRNDCRWLKIVAGIAFLLTWIYVSR